MYNKTLLADPSISIEIKRDIMNTLGSDLFTKEVNITKPLIFRKGFKFEQYVVDDAIIGLRCEEEKDTHIYVVYKPIMVEDEFYNIVEVSIKITKFNKEEGGYELVRESSKLYHTSALDII